jgi:hypothetical protein
MKPTIVLLFHAGDILFSLGVVILMCLAVVVVFSTLAQRVGEKTQKRHRPAHKKPGRRGKSGG